MRSRYLDFVDAVADCVVGMMVIAISMMICAVLGVMFIVGVVLVLEKVRVLWL